jgi:TfoX/Sxy family transcriptional regulator of competence genes
VPPDVVDALDAGRKAELRPLHDHLMSAIDALGEVEIAPKKGYLSLRRRKQSAMIEPSAVGRIDLGLKHRRHRRRTLRVDTRRLRGGRLTLHPSAPATPYRRTVTDASVRSATLERVRRALAGRADVVEKRMVGGVSFSYRDRMFCGVTSAGLMVRVGAEGREAALGEAHVRPLELGRRQPVGFVVVEPPGYATEELLEAWIERGLAAVRSPE